MSPYRSSLLALPLFVAGCAESTLAPVDPPALGAPAEASVLENDLNEGFRSPDLKVDEFVERFEGESREVFRERSRILEVLALRPGLDVADVGAGTGLFTLPMARAVGPDGVVHAVEIAPNFIAHVEERAAAEGLSNVRTVLCTESDARLEAGSVDLVFVCDTYHHFAYPASTLGSLRRALRPGGRLVVVDFERIPGVSREWLLDHVRAGKEVFRAEIEAAGFRFDEEVEIAGLEENYCLTFTRP
ncbi:MAG: class I SAM-dependent methyltransferase [Planctomycetota bacterium JB042]